MTKSCESTAAEKHSSSGGNASNQKRLKTELTSATSAQHANFQPSVREIALLSEFNQESETVFMQDDVCYEHYKEMQRDQK